MFKYLPEVMGTEMCSMRLTMPNGGRGLPVRLSSFLVSRSHISQSIKNENISAALSPKITAAAHAPRPLVQNLPTSTTISIILTACSSNCETAFGVILRRAMKYPRRQDESPIKGSESGSILSAGTARISFKNRTAINSAPKNTVTTVTAAISRVISMARRSILSVPRFVPRANSSAASLVTAVLIPLVAKVAASIYTLNIS